MSSECQGHWGCPVQSWAEGMDEDEGVSGGTGMGRWRQASENHVLAPPLPQPQFTLTKQGSLVSHLERGGASRVHWLHQGGNITDFNYKKFNTFACVISLQVQSTNVQMEHCFPIIFLGLWLLVSPEAPAHVKVLHLKV